MILRKLLVSAALIGLLCGSAGAQQQPARTVATGQISCGTGATALVPVNATRQFVTIENTTATAIYLGPTSGVTSGNGHLLPGVIGASITIPSTAALFCISSAPSTVSYLETGG